MSGDDVVELLQRLGRHPIEVWVDGGWGVDALLGEQTRPHGDLDIAIAHADVPRRRARLAARGYRDVPRNDTRDFNFVLGDDEGRQVDVQRFGVASPAEYESFRARAEGAARGDAG